MLTSVSFIGGGNMASAMISGLRRLDPMPAIMVSEPDPDKRATFTAQGIIATAETTQAVAASTVIVLAVKPQVMATAMREVAAAWSDDKILVSILAGTPIARMAQFLPPGARIVRCMPNTPLAIGQGMVGICAGARCGEADLLTSEALFAPCAQVLRLADESRMDAITAVSGSGPAYFFKVAEALVASAQSLGFSKAEAELLVAQTGSGAWAYLMHHGISRAGELRHAVTSPGGTTAAALNVLAQADFDGLWARALSAARDRGAELARL